MTGEHPPTTSPPERPREPVAAAESPDYGPRGYLPGRAAQRARKIVLREQLGLGWVIASALAGVLLLAAGVWFVGSRLGPPRPPFVAAGTASEMAFAEATQLDAAGDAVLLVRSGGRLRAFVAPDTPVHYCAESTRLEGADGTVWGLDGRRVSAEGPSLAELPLEVHRGTVYVNPSASMGPLQPHDDAATPACPAPAG